MKEREASLPVDNLLADLKRAHLLLEGLNSPGGDVDAFMELLKKLYVIHDYETMGSRLVATYECGSVRMKDTPAVLYRALFLFRPERVSFKDMYKSAFLTMVSPDYHLVATIEFFKYEIGVYFAATREHIDGTKGHGVIAGLPGSDNGVHFQGETAQAWFDLLIGALNRSWMVYGGNDFEV